MCMSDTEIDIYKIWPDFVAAKKKGQINLKSTISLKERGSIFPAIRTLNINISA